MKRSHLLILAVIIFLTACTPSAAQVAVSETATSVPTSTVAPTATSTPTSTPTVAPTPTQVGGGSGSLVFTYAQEEFVKRYPDLEGQRHVFMTHLNGTHMEIISEGMGELNFVRSISPDAKKLLIAAFDMSGPDDLFVVDLSKEPPEASRVVENYTHPTIFSPAAWIDNERFVYWGNGAEGMGFYQVDLEGSEPQRIDAASAAYKGLLAVNEEHVYWYSRVYKDYGSRRGDYYAVWATHVDGSGESRLESAGRQVEYYVGAADFSPDGKKVAWIPSAPEPECDTPEKIKNFDHENRDIIATCNKLYVADLADMDNPLILPLTPIRGVKPEGFEYIGNSYHVIWSNDNHTIFLQSTGAFFSPEFMFSIDLNDDDPQMIWLRNFPPLNYETDTFNGRTSGLVGFSPDGRIGMLKVTTREKTKQTALIDLETMRILDPFLGRLNQDKIDSLHWLP